MSTITLKGIIDEDFVNYRVPSMTLMFPKCSFKCGKDCQNQELAKEPDIEVDIDSLCERYLNNPITKAIVCQGLEPLDSQDSLFEFLSILRNKYNCYDDVVIYTGYTEEEVGVLIATLRCYQPVVIKYGRYIAGNEPHYDEILGVKLASNNQYAKRIIEDVL